ncbi:hypothetical protein [Streptomyces boluensis]|uniref:Uncharacterized protein n=1 Tax=Streptomyces boluensis TaxID=1775135 RepID=A0A964UPJ1_9ACTN|nr:hypothetical protein [Streptomyces boluensis]NBE53054.1 hypothetical protein [Streptomyces boluensis]
MPRRRPGRVRVEGRLHPRSPYLASRSKIPELSVAAHAEIARIERSRSYLWVGATETSLLLWDKFVRTADHRLWVGNRGGCWVWECCGDPYLARDFLEGVLLSMSPRGRRELWALVGPLDARY